MYKNFHSVEDLYQWIEEDKNWTGAESAMRNRYPVRFVLFENFRDFYAFTEECGAHGVFVQSMEGWMKDDVDDSLLTYSKLGRMFKEYISKVPSNDFVIAPFSEITRFYENSADCTEFDSLVKTIRLIESNAVAQETHQRIYVPIIGMQSKMYHFKDDTNIHIWEYLSQGETQNYHLILTKGTLYDVQGLDTNYTVCHNVREWIAMWKQNTGVKQNIICSSNALFNNAHNAQPDNAFDYTICHNAFEFLSKGLNIEFGDVTGNDDEMHYWVQLARDVDNTDFDFLKYVTERFNVASIDSVQDFMQVWFDDDHKDFFSRWLLKTYYVITHKEDTYLKRVLQQNNSLTTANLFSTIATLIFEEPQNDKALEMRAVALREGARQGVILTEMAERIIDAKLQSMAADPECGTYTAMKYMSPITDAEKKLMLQWLGEGRINRESLKILYPELYSYTAPVTLPLTDGNAWVNGYFTEYNKSKLANNITEELSAILCEKNGSQVSFEGWRDNFKTVKTQLHGREDIDVYYWIDGLGVDWVPFITSIIKEHEVDNVFLNEVYIATAELPTRTSNNKIKLEELCGGKLEKIGDIDNLAHKHKSYPGYIDDEFHEMKKAISMVLDQFNGKKIAFISDHGMSYLSCLAPGKNIVGIKGDHSGRCGEWKLGKATQDNNYIILDDGKTVCSLTHHSLTAKVPDGQGAHGGATPEEVLVPIIIVSSKKNANNYSVQIQNYEISANAPVLTYIIKGLSSIDVPVLEYNGAEYMLTKKAENKYESERLNLVDTATNVTVRIGSFKQTDSIKIQTGAEEDDLFNDFM